MKLWKIGLLLLIAMAFVTCDDGGTTNPCASGHLWGTYVYNNDAKCEADGTETAACQRAGCTAKDTRPEAGSALMHLAPDGYPATCTALGNTGTGTCTREGCNAHVVGEIIPIDPNNHDWNDWTVLTIATCTAAGTQERTCKLNAEHTETRSNPDDLALNHDMGEWETTIPITNVNTLTETGRCQRSGCDHIESRPIEPTITLAQWIAAQSGGETADDPVYIPLSLDDLSGNSDTPGNIGYIIKNQSKYVSLDFSSSTFPSIEADVFRGCTNLVGIIIPDSVTSIKYYSFGGCASLTSVTIPDSVENIEQGAFSGCTGLVSVTMGNSVKNIGYAAFSHCTSLENINIPDSVTSIDEFAFINCRTLESITIPDSVESIGSSTFYYCSSLESVIIGNSVTSIGEHAFRECTNLTNVTIGNSVTSIGEWVFYECLNLSSITIPASVASIGEYAFISCTSLVSVTFERNGYTTITSLNTFPGGLEDTSGGIGARNRFGTYTRESGNWDWTKVAP